MAFKIISKEEQARRSTVSIKTKEGKTITPKKEPEKKTITAAFRRDPKTGEVVDVLEKVSDAGKQQIIKEAAAGRQARISKFDRVDGQLTARELSVYGDRRAPTRDDLSRRTLFAAYQRERPTGEVQDTLKGLSVEEQRAIARGDVRRGRQVVSVGGEGVLQVTPGFAAKIEQAKREAASQEQERRSRIVANVGRQDIVDAQTPRQPTPEMRVLRKPSRTEKVMGLITKGKEAFAQAEKETQYRPGASIVLGLGRGVVRGTAGLTQLVSKASMVQFGRLPIKITPADLRAAPVAVAAGFKEFKTTFRSRPYLTTSTIAGEFASVAAVGGVQRGVTKAVRVVESRQAAKVASKLAKKFKGQLVVGGERELSTAIRTPGVKVFGREFRGVRLSARRKELAGTTLRDVETIPMLGEERLISRAEITALENKPFAITRGVFGRTTTQELRTGTTRGKIAQEITPAETVETRVGFKADGLITREQAKRFTTKEYIQGTFLNNERTVSSATTRLEGVVTFEAASAPEVTATFRARRLGQGAALSNQQLRLGTRLSGKKLSFQPTRLLEFKPLDPADFGITITKVSKGLTTGQARGFQITGISVVKKGTIKTFKDIIKPSTIATTGGYSVVRGGQSQRTVQLQKLKPPSQKTVSKSVSEQVNQDLQGTTLKSAQRQRTTQTSKQRFIQVTEQKTISKTLQAQSLKRFPLSGVATKQSSKQRSKQSQSSLSKQIVKPITKQLPATKTAQAQAQSLVTSTSQIAKTVTSLSSKQRTKIARLKGLETKQRLFKPETDRVEKSLRSNYTVQVRRKGRFETVGVEQDIASASNLGRGIVKDTAAASYRVIGRGGQAIQLNSPGREFRTSNKESGVQIQRREFRIKSSGELREITYEGIASTKGKKKRLRL